MKKVLLAGLLTCFQLFVIAQSVNVYPTHWWTGMKNKKLQLMLHAEGIGNGAVTINYPGVKVEKVNKVENKNYLFIDLTIAPQTKPGKFSINIKKTASPITLQYELKARRPGNGRQFAQGVTSSDFIYLLMPDRFSNGDSSNDKFDDLRDTVATRKLAPVRHGGDLKGVQNHLDYVKELGVTAIWMTPIVENDMPQVIEGGVPKAGYHGYWITDNYKIDKRYGGNEAFHKLVNAAHNKGLKIVQDAVYNHVGAYHWSVLDMPMKDWVNQWPRYQQTHYKEEVFFDPHATAIDKKVMTDGWFVPHLPDLNLANPFVANYVIQNSIWITEEFGIDGWRVDTYKYCEENFLNRINNALLQEFPNLTVFGEAWCSTVVASAYFARNNMNVPFKHNLQGITDFPVCFAMQNIMKQSNDNLANFYNILAQDFLYKDPLRNCIFLDNHDMDRISSTAGGDVGKLKVALGLLLTTRGIPEMYYGTEILMKGVLSPEDANVRADFPGGFAGDRVNKFEKNGRTTTENDVYNYIKTLANFRAGSSAIKTGKLTQYIPQNNLYVYFRYDDNQTIMCIINNGNAETPVDFTKYNERTNGFKKAKSILNDQEFSVNSTFAIPAKTMWVLELKK